VRPVGKYFLQLRDRILGRSVFRDSAVRQSKNCR